MNEASAICLLQMQLFPKYNGMRIHVNHIYTCISLVSTATAFKKCGIIHLSVGVNVLLC